jgi:hypothetical protein
MVDNDDDWFDSFGEICLDYVCLLRGQRCSDLTWLFSGDILDCIEGTHLDLEKRRSSLPQDAQIAAWMSICGCKRAVFEELLAPLWRHTPENTAVIP